MSQIVPEEADSGKPEQAPEDAIAALRSQNPSRARSLAADALEALADYGLACFRAAKEGTTVTSVPTVRIVNLVLDLADHAEALERQVQP